MQITRISNWQGLDSVASDWDSLSQGTVFNSRAWLATWWRHYGDHGPSPKRDLYVLAVRDHCGALVGLAPWYRNFADGRRASLRFLGSGEVCTDHLSVLCRPDRRLAVAECLADWLLDIQRESSDEAWELLELGHVDADDAQIRELVKALANRGTIMYARPGPRCWRLELPPSWDEYVELLSKSHRKQVRRCQRRWLDSGLATLRMESQCGPELDRGLNILSELHQRRRQQMGQAGCFASDRFAAFCLDASRQLAAAGALRLSWLEIDGKPIAAEHQLTDHRAIYAYQSGLDPDYLRFEPGRLATIATLRQAIDHGYRAIDFLRGDEAYKAHWRARPRETLTLSIWPDRAANWMRRGACIAGENVKHWLKSGLKLAGVIAGESKEGVYGNH